MMDSDKNPMGCRCNDGIVYTPWITVKGIRVYAKKGKVFAFPCKRCVAK